MKRIIAFIVLCGLSLFAFSEENEFTWVKYEMECFKRGSEPSFKEYEDLVNNPTDYHDEYDITLLFEGISDYGEQK